MAMSHGTGIRSMTSPRIVARDPRGWQGADTKPEKKVRLLRIGDAHVHGYG